MKSFSKTNIGGRTENQDNYINIETKFGLLFLICDGMGGTKGGKLASQTAIDVVSTDIKNSKSEDVYNAVHNAIQKANFEIFRQGVSNAELKGMGTTVSLLLLSREKSLIAHVGDSRIYQYRNKKQIFRTDDHSVVFRLLKEGILKDEEQARNHEHSNQLTRALGVEPVVDIEINECKYLKDDVFILCSDGICGELSEVEIHKIVADNFLDIEKISDNLLDFANKKGINSGGGHDNMTITTIKTENSSINNRLTSSPKVGIKDYLIVFLTASLLTLVYLGFIKDKIKFWSTNNSTQTTSKPKGNKKTKDSVQLNKIKNNAINRNNLNDSISKDKAKKKKELTK